MRSGPFGNTSTVCPIVHSTATSTALIQWNAIVVRSCRSPCVSAGSVTIVWRIKSLTAAYQNARGEHQGAAKCHLECGGNRRRVHVPPAHPTDNRQLHDHDTDRQPRSGPEIWYEIRQRMTDAAQRGHNTGDR